MAAPRQRVISTGATGKQGGALIQALLDKPSQPFEIFAVTRNTDSGSAKKLASRPNVKVIQGDFDHPDQIFAQVKDPSGLFLVTTPGMGQKDGAIVEERQGKAVVTAAIKSGVDHIVFNSVDRAVDSENNDTPIPHFRSKKRIEEFIKAEAGSRGTTWTIVRPVAFMDNLTNDFIGKIFMAAWQQNGKDTKLQLVGTRDIGRVSAEALLDAGGEDYKNKAIALAGDELSPTEAAAAFHRATGKTVPSTFGIFATLSKAMMPDELGKMFKWFKDVGYGADVPAVRRKYPFLKTFEEWVAEESAWKKS